MPKFCSNCGSPYDLGVQFCPNCGFEVGKISQSNEDLLIKTTHDSKSLSQGDSGTHHERRRNNLKNQGYSTAEVGDDDAPLSSGPSKRSHLMIFSILLTLIVGGFIVASELGYINIGKPENNESGSLNSQVTIGKTDTSRPTNPGESSTSIQSDIVPLNKRAEDFIRSHYQDIANHNFSHSWNNYAPEFIQDKCRNNSPICTSSRYADMWANTSNITVSNFQIGNKPLNYTYMVHVTDYGGKVEDYFTEIQLHETDGNFKITWFGSTLQR